MAAGGAGALPGEGGGVRRRPPAAASRRGPGPRLDRRCSRCHPGAGDAGGTGGADPGPGRAKAVTTIQDDLKAGVRPVSFIIPTVWEQHPSLLENHPNIHCSGPARDGPQRRVTETSMTATVTGRPGPGHSVVARVCSRTATARKEAMRGKTCQTQIKECKNEQGICRTPKPL